MQDFDDFLNTLETPSHRDRFQEIFTWIQATYPKLVPVIKWNQPMYQYHGTFIIGFSAAKEHISVSVEAQGQAPFVDKLEQNDYSYTEGLFRIKWSQKIDYQLLENMIDFNIQDKENMTRFWR